MNVITWNVRGLGKPAKRFLVKDFLNLHFANVCCLQESKLEEISLSSRREIGGSRLDQYLCVPARGTAGGIIIGWNSGILKGKLVKKGLFSLKVDFYSKRDNLLWRYTTIYGPNARTLKQDFWDELRSCLDSQEIPWIICGDFNAIFDLGDKSGGPPNLEDIRDANAFLHDLHLLEPPMKGRRFSWTNGQAEPTWVKLDRFIVNGTCANLFTKMIQNSLSRLGSDHVPIRLEVGYHCSKPRPFRYERAWSRVEGFHDLVKIW